MEEQERSGPEQERPGEPTGGEPGGGGPGEPQPRFGADGRRPRRRGGRGRGGRGGESPQTREIRGYEQRQQRGPRPPQFGGPRPAYGGGMRPAFGAGPRPQGAGYRQPWRRPAAGTNYQQQLRRVTGGPTTGPNESPGEPIAGTHAVLEALRAGRFLKTLYVAEDRSLRSGPIQDVLNEAQARRVRVNFLDKFDLARVAPVENHQGVVGIFEPRTGVDLEELLLHLDQVREPALVLVIDSLQDPQNFGVLLRSADGAGAHGVVIPRHRQVGVTAAVAKTSAGASEHLLVADVTNLRQAIDEIKAKGIWVVGTAEDGDLYYDEVDYRNPTAIVVGGEGEGMRRLVREACDQVVRIPMKGKVNSLNAAAAGTLILYEALRQRVRDVAPSPRRPLDPRPASPEATDAEPGEPDESDAGAAGANEAPELSSDEVLGAPPEETDE